MIALSNQNHVAELSTYIKIFCKFDRLIFEYAKYLRKKIKLISIEPIVILKAGFELGLRVDVNFANFDYYNCSYDLKGN